MIFGRKTQEPNVLIDNSVPIVIMKSYHYHGLGIARSLGRLGVPIYGIGKGRASGLLSRYFCQKFIWGVADDVVEQTVQYLNGGRQERWQSYYVDSYQ